MLATVQQETTVARPGGERGKQSPLGIYFENEPIGFVDRLNVEYESKMRVKESSKVFCLFAFFFFFLKEEVEEWNPSRRFPTGTLLTDPGTEPFL